MNEPKEGDVIGGKYRVQCRLGMGGMGAVYLANVEGLAGFEKLVALKIAHDHLSIDKVAMEMFLQEAKLSALLQHANIGQVFDLGKTDDDLYFIAMEYVRGRDLRALMNAVADHDGRLPVPIIVHICARLLEGLDYAHGLRDKTGRPLKLVHRDVTPSNCLISYTGEVKLIDFGIAKAANQASKTKTGMVKGKLDYFSPEQARGDPVDRRSDVFAMGVVLYELLVDERPFEAASDMSVMTNIVTGGFRPPRELDLEVPEELNAIVTKALSHDRGGRYATAGEMQDALEHYLMSSQLRVSAKDLAAFLVSMVGSDAVAAEGAPGVSLTGETLEKPLAQVTREAPASRLVMQTRSRRASADVRKADVTTESRRKAGPSGTRISKASQPRKQAAATIDEEISTLRPAAPAQPISRVTNQAIPPVEARSYPTAVVLAALAGLGVGAFVWVAQKDSPEPPRPAPPVRASPVSPALSPVERVAARPVEPVLKTEPRELLVETATPPKPPVKALAKPLKPAEKQPVSRDGVVTPFANRPVEKKPVEQQPRELEAFLTVRSNQLSEVFVDGVNIGRTPRLRYAVKAGRHQLRVDCIYDWGRHVGPQREVDLPPDAEAEMKHQCVENEARAAP